MTQEEATRLLAYLNRAGLVQAVAGAGAVWHDALSDVRFEDAQAVARDMVRRPGLSFVTPGDFYGEVRRLRRSRIADRVPPAPPVELDAAGDLRFRRVYVRALGDGATEAEADAAACGVVGVQRQAVEARPGEVRAAIAGRLVGE